MIIKIIFYFSYIYLLCFDLFIILIYIYKKCLLRNEDQNIGKINKEYDIAMKRQQEINQLTFEDRIIQYQKDCEKRIRKEVEDEVRR